MKDKLIKLIDLKSIITLSLTATSIAGFFMGKISPELMATWIGMVYVFYFKKKDSE